ncbi:uroplakin-3b [Xenopus laevis]|uniref:Uncharacterized protein n=2 Tax=Xenopus laevis TaxID=8355 RepID=A0A974DN61_XENLA|nr:uroplakin-3b [Xenopus laevis]OCT95023.1 hypothetical protein XELAEV_18012708mg [Xenopus laevis]
MDLLGRLLLLIATLAITVADIPYYVPRITTKPILGKLTSSSFVLDQPQCIFHQYKTSQVWLVVALNRVIPQLSYMELSNPANISSFETNRYYHTLPVIGGDYPCADVSGKLKAMIYVGSDVNCSNPLFCNGPVPSLGTYRVRFVVLNGTGMETGTRWSEVITLRKGIDPSTINTWPTKYSFSMIVITTLLASLLLVLLVCLIVALALGSKDVWWFKNIDLKEKKEPAVSVNKDSFYRTHPMYSAHNRKPYLTMTKEVEDYTIT